jgi:predicted  nucleic acid-binding Zn-ribbon protein
MDISDFVQWAGGASALIASLSWAWRQGVESLATLAKARAARTNAEAAKLTAEAAQDIAGARALEDALERVDKLEGRVGELEGALQAAEERREVELLAAADARCHLEGQLHILGQELDVERRARGQAEDREHALARELTELRHAITGGHTGLPTPLRPPKP